MHDAMNTTSAPQEVTAIDLVALERRVLLDKIVALEGEVQREQHATRFWCNTALRLEEEQKRAQVKDAMPTAVLREAIAHMTLVESSKRISRFHKEKIGESINELRRLVNK